MAFHKVVTTFIFGKKADSITNPISGIVHGLLAASEALRHGGIGVTARHYVENRSHSVLGFGHLLTKGERTIIPMEEAQAS